MESIQLGGSTADLAETIIDFKTKKVELKGIPEGTLRNRLFAAAHDWFFYLMKFWIITAVALVLIDRQLNYAWHFLAAWTLIFILFILLISLHINKKFDHRMKRYFALKTAKEKDFSKVTVTKFNNKEFVIPDIQNIALDFEVSGDVKTQLSKIWIKQEDKSGFLLRQGTITSYMQPKKQDNTWNAYFIFKRIPKGGKLHVEYI